ncbi:cysteine desulfurase [Paenibacillus sp. P2(2022)]|uniref:cysteine desulfurase family protein n=1 Tax=Paenibacillus TaxID=44249 RepID=UPI00057FD22A|nr:MULTISPECIES: cysteine desulfurase family protein [Paenibacillus]AIY07816.1 cysteine desulfurase [Paenibacillus polymyxa]AUS27599.1 aminotransferase V [Paenibacillus polymyxa]KJK31501.1 cysteine desulfurase [Paenibacillus polymyxa]MDG0052522.1 cysteine desulfurase [Paenibacillus sp. P2(2022)]WOZ36908.1 cysteine desulfurase family protein [Paenibacillus polymyxa]
MKYFDYAATTPPFEEVITTVAEVMRRHYGNPSSMHRYGEDAAKLIKRSREVCAAALGVSPSEIVFTSGATESNNLAVKGAALQYQTRGKHIVTVSTEHPSVYEACKQLTNLGFEVTFLPVDEEGHVTAEQVCAAVRKDTILVSIMHVNNETGRVQPLHDIGAALKKRFPRVLFHIDGVQGFGKLPVDIRGWQADLYSLSAHKLRGPKGVGLLFVREGVELFPLLSGGSQEQGVRAGTENVPSLVGMSKAVRLAGERQAETAQRMIEWRERVAAELKTIPQLRLNSGKEAPHIVHFSYPGMKAEVLLHTLEQLGVAVSTKSACSSKLAEPSRVLLAMGRNEAEAAGGIRISFGDEHTEQDIDELILALRQAVAKLESLERWKR